MAAYLGRAGHRVDVYERRGDPRRLGIHGGRSINLAISTRGLHALEGVGLRERVLEGAVSMRGRLMHDEAGALSYQPYGVHAGDVIHSVSRGGLNLTLIEGADELPDVTFHFDRRVLDVDLDAPAMVVERDGVADRIEADALIGADGAFSAVRARMQRTDRFDYSQSYLQHGYKELTIPPSDDGTHRMRPDALHIWPRGGYMMIALPNDDGSFTCTLFWPFTGEPGVDTLRTDDDVLRFFESRFPDAVPRMPTLLADFATNPTSSLVTVRCKPWTLGGRVALLGDAAHAVVPFYGQGANAAFEDCVVLHECLERHGGELVPAFREYDVLRKDNVDALADLAIANFIEMRDHVSSRSFLWKKRAEKILHRLFPRWFLPLYQMITFSRIPYAEARRRAARQDRRLRRVLRVAGWTVGVVAVAWIAAWLF